MADAVRVLVKLRPSLRLSAVDARTNLRALYGTSPTAASFGLTGAPAWYLAELPDGDATPWDSAHARVADQLGVAASDVLFAEPDLVHDIYRSPNEAPPAPFAVGENCGPEEQTDGGGRSKGPAVFAWHLGNAYSQLGAARDAVEFSEPRTRIAHIDTGYDNGHASKPEHIVHDLERNFVGRRRQSERRRGSRQPRLSARQLGPRHRHHRHPRRRQGPRTSATRTSAARPARRSCRCASPTASCCCAPARFAQALHYAVDEPLRRRHAEHGRPALARLERGGERRLRGRRLHRRGGGQQRRPACRRATWSIRPATVA